MAGILVVGDQTVVKPPGVIVPSQFTVTAQSKLVAIAGSPVSPHNPKHVNGIMTAQSRVFINSKPACPAPSLENLGHNFTPTVFTVSIG